MDYLYQLYLGASAGELKKFRDVIGVGGDEEKAQWDFLLDVLDQMVIQSTHYTTVAEKKEFLEHTEHTVTFIGLSGLIRTVVGGGAATAVRLISEEVFRPHNVRELEFSTADALFDEIRDDFTNVFVVTPTTAGPPRIRSLSKVF